MIILLGAGASIPAGLPSSSELTDKILNAVDFYRHSIGSYYPLSGQVWDDVWSMQIFERGDIPRILTSLLDYLRNSGKDDPSYEDLFDLVSSDFELYGESPIRSYNLTSCPRSELYQHIASVPFKKQLPVYPDTPEEWTKKKIEESELFIKSIVYHELSRPIISDSTLSFILELAQQKDQRPLTIATLNHDTIVEQVFQASNRSLFDGFQKTDMLCPFVGWQETRIASNTRLIKLHGSINWWHRREGEKITLHRMDTIGEEDRGNFSSLALFVTGSLAKQGVTNRTGFKEMFDEFKRSLDCNDTLFVCGYSFRDEHVNDYIENWMRSSRQNILTVFDPNVNKLRDSTRFFNSRVFDITSRIKFSEKSVQDLTHDDFN